MTSVKTNRHFWLNRKLMRTLNNGAQLGKQKAAKPTKRRKPIQKRES